MFEPGLLRGKRILITGGGTGLGAAMATGFAQLGSAVVICGRRMDVLQDRARQIAEETGGVAEVESCDIRSPEAVEAMMDRVYARAPLDALVNNAGALIVGQTEHLSHRAIDAVLKTNLHGPFYCTTAVGRRWIEADRPGVVLSILSTATLTGRAFTVPTTVAKTGLLAMTRSLAVEWAPHGIRLVAIAPGSINTGAFAERVSGLRPALDATTRNSLERAGTPEMVADLAVFLLSDRAGYINGEMIALDGGRHLRNSGADHLLALTDEDWARLRANRTR